MFVKCVICK